MCMSRGRTPWPLTCLGMMGECPWFLAVLAALCILRLAACSAGDRSHEFRSCVAVCWRESCGPKGPPLPAHLALLGWDCLENCQYDCMHSVTAEATRKGHPVRQFYGKWPFVRLLGIQEPASTLFSVMNAATVAYGFSRFMRLAPLEYPCRRVIALQSVVSLHTWFWSAVFHSRDTLWTERMDYFSASSMVVSGLLLQFVMLTGAQAVLWHWCYALVLGALYAAHIGYLALFKFDYGYNMTANVAVGALYTTVWLIWCLKCRKERRYVWKCAAVVLATSSLLSLELLDFSPMWWTFDAHSLWHLSTVPLPLLWYSFLTDDANYQEQTTKKGV